LTKQELENKWLNKVYGDFKIIEILEERYEHNGSHLCLAQCIKCGNTKKGVPNDIKRFKYKHNINNCKENFLLEEIGKEYGDIKIIKYIGIQSGCYKYLAECKVCKRTKEVWIKDIKKGHAINHYDCVWLLPKDQNTKRLRNIWSHMVARCTNPNSEKYHCYGGRGIKTQYDNFIEFYDDFYTSYIEHVELHGERETTIERINVDEGYFKDNMKWATWEEQVNNKRSIRSMKVTYPNGISIVVKNISKFARENKLKVSSIHSCLNNSLKHYKKIKFEYA